MFECLADRRTASLRAFRIRRAACAYSAFAFALVIIVAPEFWKPLYPGSMQVARLLASAAIISSSSTLLCGMVLRFILNIIFLLLIVHFLERKDNKSIGLAKPSSDDFFAAIAAWLFFNAMLPVQTAYVRIIEARGCPDLAPALLPLPQSWFLALVASDAVFEELATRAYVIERVSYFTGSEWLGATASLLLSVGMHIPRGDGICAGLLPALMLALFTGLYVWRRSVAPCALAHFLVDVQMVFGIPFLGQWLHKPHHPAILLTGMGLIYCAVRWRWRSTHRPGAFLPAASE